MNKPHKQANSLTRVIDATQIYALFSQQTASCKRPCSSHKQHRITIDTLTTPLGAMFAATTESGIFLLEFSIPIDLPGTDFQQKVWKALQDIPYGTTRSYQQQVKAIGNTHAVRAVARANAENRIAIIVPCHRVTGKNGQLTGYGGGIWRKKQLQER